MSEFKLYSDIDGTVLKEGDRRISPSVRKVLSDLKPNGLGFASTRGLLRSREVTEELSSLPIIVENSGAIFTPEGRLINSFPLTNSEKEAVADVMRVHTPIIKLAAFYPKDSAINGHRAIIFTSSEARKQHYMKSLSHIIKQATTDPEQFIRLLMRQSTTMIELQPEEQIKFPEGLNVSTDGIVYINSEGVNKGHALHDVCDITNILLENLVVAGNQETDTSMFRLPNVISIAVNNRTLQATHHVASPEELVSLLRTI